MKSRRGIPAFSLSAIWLQALILSGIILCQNVHAFTRHTRGTSLASFRQQHQWRYQSTPLNMPMQRGNVNGLALVSPPGLQQSLSSSPVLRQPDQSRLFGRRENWTLHQTSRYSLFLRIICLPLIGILGFPLQALAAATSVVPTLKAWKHVLPNRKNSLRILVLSLAVTFAVRLVRLQRRQALDATSEWARYANHPAARGRALGSLICLQLLPLWILTRTLTLCGKKERAERMRTRTGNVFADGLLRLG